AQQAAAGMEINERLCFPAALPEHMSRSQGRMSAEIDFGRRGKPAQNPATLAQVRHTADKSGFREIHLRRHLLHPLGRLFLLQYTDRRRVAGEGPIGKSIDDINRLTHGNLSRGLNCHSRPSPWRVTVSEK